MSTTTNINFAVEPRPGDKHRRFLDHVRDLCNGDPDLYQYLMSWMARAVQKPDAPGEVAVVLHGKRGTGKSLFARIFGTLFGWHFQIVYDTRHIAGNFNARLRDCVVLFADEAIVDESCARVKTLLTEETIVIEQKGRDPEVVPNHVHLIMASNEPWTTSSATDARRFFVLDVTTSPMRDNVYFSAMSMDLKAGGYGHLLHALRAWDISSFDHRAIPRQGVRPARGMTVLPAGVVVTEVEADQRWEDLDGARRMFGVFDNNGYSADPIAIFRTKQSADTWLAWDKSRGDDRVVWGDICVLPIDDLAGRVWNSLDPAQARP